jgi:penicillin-binding protein 1C
MRLNPIEYIKLRPRLKKFLIIFSCTLIGFYLLFRLVDKLFPLPLERLNYSTVVLASDGSVLSAYLSEDDKWRIKIEKEDIPASLKKAFLFKEDKHFYHHFGINPISVIRAFFQDIRAGKVVSGASTITMQVAKMLSPERRTFGNKFKEMFRALQLERQFTKEQILEMYFNLLPYGGNVEGIKAASVIYLHKLPVNLSTAEIATLMIIPNNPNHYRFGKANGTIVAARNKWLERFDKAHVFPDKEIQQGLTEPLAAKRMEILKIAPHLCNRLSEKIKDVPYIQTNVDFNAQKRTQQIITEYVHKLAMWGITNAAAIIIRNKDHAVIAYVGSADFNDVDHQGQVDGANAIRSPGSALKPFLYGMAFDQGMVTPKTVMYDVPCNFNGYQPQDYDRTYRGKVSVEDALLNSLNVPAVSLLNKMDLTSYIGLLENGGCTSLVKQEKKLGLSLVLGGCGIKLQELTGLYVALANRGEYAPLRFTKNQAEVKTVRLFTEDASFMLSHILTEMVRYDVPANLDDAMHFPKIAWKTGTSYGHHDGWCVGYDDEYTVGVWVGNFNDAESPELSGSSCAVPLMTQIFSTLSIYNDFNWLKFPKHLSTRMVCAETGKIPSNWCTNQIMDYYIPGVSNTDACDHMQMVYVDPKEKLSYCRSCLPKAGYVEKLYPNYPPEMINYFALYNIPYQKVPEHNPECPRVYKDKSIAIESPVNGMEYILMKKESHSIMLKCEAGNDVTAIYWYVNDKFFGKAKPEQTLFFTPEDGKVKVSCTDDKGRTANVKISVREI